MAVAPIIPQHSRNYENSRASKPYFDKAALVCKNNENILFTWLKIDSLGEAGTATTIAVLGPIAYVQFAQC